MEAASNGTSNIDHQNALPMLREAAQASLLGGNFN
jgi:hypothetical protein